MILGYANTKDNTDSVNGIRPDLYIISRTNEEISCDTLGISSYEKFQPKDYRLCSTVSEFYILSPKEIVVAVPRDENDHLQWLLDRKKYKEAFSIVKGREKQFRVTKNINIGDLFLEKLLDENNYEEAGKESPAILKDNISGWTNLISKFIDHSKITLLVDHLPTGEPYALQPQLYAFVLIQLLNEGNFSAAERALKLWKPEVYSPIVIRTYLETKLHEKIDERDTAGNPESEQAVRALSDLLKNPLFGKIPIN